MPTPLGPWLAARTPPGRCPCCGWALNTLRGHRTNPDCVMGFRARFAIGRDGQVHGTKRNGGGPKGLD